MKHYCETDRLILNIMNSDSVPMVLAFYEDNKAQFEKWEQKRPNHFYSLSYQKASLSADYYQIAEGKLLRYWVFLKENPDEIVGTVCFQNFLKAPYLSCTIGYKFNQKYSHNGYAFESIQKGLEIIFNEYGMHRIEAFIMPNNMASLRLIERLPFIYEGISYSYANINGIWSDHKRYVCINPKDVTLPAGTHPDLVHETM